MPVAPIQLTRPADGDEQLLYFTSSSLTADDASLVTIATRAGQPNLFVRDLAAGERSQLTFHDEGVLKSYVYFDGRPFAGFGKASVSLDPVRGVLFYIHGRDLRAVTLRGQSRILATLRPDEVTAFTHVSADGRLLLVPTTDARALDGDFPDNRPSYDIDARIRAEGLASYLNLFDTRTGDLLVRERVNGAWITHVQFSPIDSHLVAYNHEWPSDCGVRRVWLWDRRTGEHRPLRDEHEGRSRRDWTCHEMWQRDGRYILYHGRYADDGPAFVGRVRPDGSDRTEIALPPGWTQYGHFTEGPASRLVTDGYYRESDDPADGCGRWIAVLDVDWSAGRIDWFPLVRHGSSWSSQDAHPHPVFDHAGRTVFFTSDAEGQRCVYRAPTA